MGLASALNTALTGMTGSEATISVVGNNLANANTVGFKPSSVSFATQFLQTESIGSTPTTTNGGTDPLQTGLGTMVSATTPNFSQGTIQTGSTSTDMAIQGDGFFIVQGLGGAQYYTRNGEFSLNSSSELVSATGNRVLGYGVDSNYNISSSSLEPLTIPLGSKAVAQATSVANLQGTLSSSGTVATQGTTLQTAVLDDAQYSQPAATTSAATLAAVTGAGATTAGATMNSGDIYTYQVTCVNSNQSPAVEVNVSPTTNVTLTGTQNSVKLTLPPLPAGTTYNVYRTDNTGTGTMKLLTSLSSSDITNNTWTDTGATASGATLPTINSLDAKYTYYVTFANSSGESRPREIAQAAYGSQAVLTNLPTDSSGQWTSWKIYRSVNTPGDSNLYYVGQVNKGSVASSTGVTFLDSATDSSISSAGAKTMSFNGPSIAGNTLASNLLVHTTADQYSSLFQVGTTFQFTGNKGNRTLTAEQLPITSATTVQDLLNFMSGSLGLRSDAGDGALATVSNSRLQITGNAGTDNALSISLSGMQSISTSGTSTINLPFSQTQAANGESAMTDFVAYDSLGTSLNVHLTAVLVGSDSTSSTWRWYADSPQSSNPSDPHNTSVGTGLIKFDGTGNFISSSGSEVDIYRSGTPALSPEVFNLNFNQISGLAATTSTLAVSSQDGSAAGTLNSFLVGEDGKISGVFSNGVTRNLGQMVLARFANVDGLQQEGENLYSSGVNSGLPITSTPGTNGAGKIVSGAVEQSKTDIGGNLVDLILASTMYRGNARVISTVQQMFDELLALRAQ